MAGKKLLVADDSLTIQKVIRLALSNEGYEIQAISDGADAIQQIATFRPNAVLIDVSLPTRSAFEIKREMNEIDDYRDMKFILMSSAFEKIDESQADDVGFDGRLTKPFDPAHLRQVLTEVLAAAAGPPTGFPSTPKTPGTPPASFPSMEPMELESSTKVFRRANLMQKEEEATSGISLTPPADLPPSDFDNDIWGKYDESQDSEPSTAHITLSKPEQQELREARKSTEQRDPDDIKHLTESTIRMSGLADFPEPEAHPPTPPSEGQGSKDDFDWSINEPSLKPPSSFASLDGSEFKMFPHPGALNQKSFDEQLNNPPPLPQQPRTKSSSASSSLPLTPPPSSSKSYQEESMESHHSAPTATFAMDGKMEDIVRRQVELTLEKLARQILPEVAERVLKEEIKRLLNEKF